MALVSAVPEHVVYRPDTEVVRAPEVVVVPETYAAPGAAVPEPGVPYRAPVAYEEVRRPVPVRV